MADAEQQDNTSQQTQPDLSGKINTVEARLNEVAEQIRAMNEGFAAATAALTAAKPAARVEEVEDDDIYEPKKLKGKILNEATSIARSLMQEERQKDQTIYGLAQEYPEIHSSAEVRKAVLAEQAKLPAAFKDTAAGYEMAVLKAVTSQGLVPKSKRQSVDADISAGNGRGTGAGARSAGSAKKVSENTVMIAELLRGRELSKEELKSLESAAQRQHYNRYR